MGPSRRWDLIRPSFLICDASIRTSSNRAGERMPMNKGGITMTANAMEALYLERLNRYVTAMRNEKPDCIPIRMLAAEFVATHTGRTCQEVTHDFNIAFQALRETTADYDWDAAVANMVYVWTGLTQAIGLKYFGIPGIDIPANTAFQYLEPPVEKSFMQADEYDELIDDPTAFLYNTWLPRASRYIAPKGSEVTYEHNLALVKGGMAMLQYLGGFPGQAAQMRTETGTVSAIAGMLKSPFDIIGDKLRGYVGLTEDMMTQPDKVMKACEALMPHLFNVAISGADPDGLVPIGFWMHRGCVPFITPQQFDSHYWPTLKPLVEGLWDEGKQIMFYAEGNWDYHLETFRELPERCMVYHIDRSDLKKSHEILGDKFCLSGGIPNALLSYGTPDEVRAKCKEVIDIAGRDGGFIMDASAIMQNDAKPENVRALTEFTREYGQYGGRPSATMPTPAGAGRHAAQPPAFLQGSHAGACMPWERYHGQQNDLPGDPQLARRIWEEIDGLGNVFIWHCLLSF